jgi:hypothetical protein
LALRQQRLGAMQRVAPFLLLAFDVGRSQRCSADAPRCIAQPFFELLVERGHVRLRLLQRLLKMRKLAVDLFGVVAEPVAALHRIN